jgi:hypothetical protein
MEETGVHKTGIRNEKTKDVQSCHVSNVLNQTVGISWADHN